MHVQIEIIYLQSVHLYFVVKLIYHFYCFFFFFYICRDKIFRSFCFIFQRMTVLSVMYLARTLFILFLYALYDTLRFFHDTIRLSQDTTRFLCNTIQFPHYAMRFLFTALYNTFLAGYDTLLIRYENRMLLKRVLGVVMHFRVCNMSKINYHPIQQQNHAHNIYCHAISTESLKVESQFTIKCLKN